MERGLHAVAGRCAWIGCNDHLSSANQAPSNDVTIPGSQVTSVVSLAEYSQPFNFAGNWAAIIVGQPFGTLSGEVTVANQKISNSSSGAGDFLFGAMLGVIGMPSLPMKVTSNTSRDFHWLQLRLRRHRPVPMMKLRYSTWNKPLGFRIALQ